MTSLDPQPASQPHNSPRAASSARTHSWARAALASMLALGVGLYWPAACTVSNGPVAQVSSRPDQLTQSGGSQAGSKQFAFLPHPAFAAAASSGVSIADIAERVTRSVVSVSTERAREESGRGFPFFFQGPPQGPHKETGMGSGVIVSADGVVLTNNHVIEGADQIRVTMTDGREIPAEVVGADKRSDLAVLKLKGEVSGLSAIELGDSARLRLGDIVLAIGNPFGVGQTVTMGIVSAKGRADVGIADYEDFIQTDAAINPGNSGGALVDMEGRLVGINTAILSRSGGYQGIGFAIPMDMARPIMDSLMQHGKVVRGYLGVGIQDLDAELVAALSLKDDKGVLISSVEPKGAGDKAGVQRGDVVISVDGTEVDSTGRLRNLIAAKGAANTVALKVVRKGKELTLNVNLGELPEAGQPTASSDVKASSGLGLQLAELNKDSAPRFGLDRTSGGVLVAGVSPGSPAAEAGIRPGDVILEINQTAVTSPSALQDRVKNSKGPVLLVIEREGRTRYVALDR